MGAIDLNRVLTFSEVAKYCDVPNYVIQRWINDKQLVVCFLTTGKQRFRLIDVIAALERHKKREAEEDSELRHRM